MSHSPYSRYTTNKELRKKIQQLETEVIEARSISKIYKDNCETLQSELSRFTKYESVRKVKQIEERLETLKQDLNSTIEELTVCSKGLKRDECSSTIGKQIAEYQELIWQLSHADITFTSEPNFPSMIGNYNNICITNDAKINDILQKLRKTTENIEYKANVSALTINDTLKDIQRFIDEQNHKLNILYRKSIQDSINVEKERYTAFSDTIARRISELNSIKALIENKTVKAETSKNVCQNIKNSVIMYNIWENDDVIDDLSKIKKFLRKVNLETNLDIKVKRLESTSRCRPLKVTFAETQLDEKILQLPNETISLLGINVRIVRCTK